MSDRIDYEPGLLGDVTLPTVDDLLADFNAAEVWESGAVTNIREDAGHHFESDGFDMSVAEDAVAALDRDSGIEPAFWLTTEAIADEIREWWDDKIRVESPGETHELRQPTAGHVPVVTVGYEDNMSDELLLIGEGAVVKPPAEVPQTLPLVKHPAGVAHYEV
jgi:hypothetical protein